MMFGVLSVAPQPEQSEECKESKDAAEVFPGDVVIELEGASPQGYFDRKPELLRVQVTEFHADFDKLERKIHRLPPILQGLMARYVVPMAVAIGPYHCRLPHVQRMDKVKNVATHHFSSGIFPSYQEMYEAFRSAIGDVDDVRSLYDDRAAGMGDDQLMSMMLVDGCFLLQYMLSRTRQDKMPTPLACFFDSNRSVINNDIMLLENQLPWVVIQTLTKFSEVPVDIDKFIVNLGRTLQVDINEEEEKSFSLDGSYTPPHLLGLFRFYKTGTNRVPVSDGSRRVPTKTVSAIELAEIGIKITASRTTKLTDIGFKPRLFSSEIFLVPLLLDEIRSCWLFNMAAFELCMGRASTSDDTSGKQQVVCSYLAILAMLMDREDDVHKLRSDRLVQGELTNKEMLDFFKSLMKGICGGPIYNHMMGEIGDYKSKRRMWIRVHQFVYKNYRVITAVLSIIGILVGIFKTLYSLKQR